ncbi:hypothetical protein Gasu2_49220 [Galdieria sulphuraria]|nr:hypothetical protein Gasu2_49220 [Galdieria sulphuraria]
MDLEEEPFFSSSALMLGSSNEALWIAAEPILTTATLPAPVIDMICTVRRQHSFMGLPTKVNCSRRLSNVQPLK